MTDDHDLRELRRASHLLDSKFRVPGTNNTFGVDPLVGLVPVVGDYVGLALSLYVVVGAWRTGLPPRAVTRMLVNVGVEAVVGSVPVLGDAFDFVWKANERNVALAERYLEAPGEARRSDARFLVGAAASILVLVVVLVSLFAVALAALLYGLARYVDLPF